MTCDASILLASLGHRSEHLLQIDKFWPRLVRTLVRTRYIASCMGGPALYARPVMQKPGSKSKTSSLALYLRRGGREIRWVTQSASGGGGTTQLLQSGPGAARKDPGVYRTGNKRTTPGTSHPEMMEASEATAIGIVLTSASASIVAILAALRLSRCTQINFCGFGCRRRLSGEVQSPEAQSPPQP
jgi:hypothetical protein